MNKLWVIATKDLGEALRARLTYVYIIVVLVFSYSYFRTYSNLINSLVRQNASQQVIYEQSKVFLNGFAYLLPLMYSIFVCSIYATYSVIVDKAKRNLESLMATPISLNQIWMGKTLAVTLPSLIIGLLVATVSYIVLNVAIAVPTAGGFVIPEPLAIVTALVLVPLLIFLIVSLVLCLQLVVSNPRLANLVFFAIFFGLFFGINILAGPGITMNVSVVYLGAIAICAIAAVAVSRALNKERVVLSSKG